MAEDSRKSISLDELLELDKNNSDFLPKIEGQKSQKLSQKDLQEAKKKNKYYLPVLNLNDPIMWESKPKSERKMFTEEIAKETCLLNCCGQSGLWSACCRLDPDDLEHTLGPVSEKWIKKIIQHFRKKGYKWTREDVVIDFEEGKLIGDKFFNSHPNFSKKTSYPMLRIQIVGSGFGCKFLNSKTGKCGIYENRPEMCRSYLCQYVKKNFLVKIKNKPNTWQKLE